MRTIISFFLLLTALSSSAKIPPFLNVDNHWADSVMMTMTLREKIGQLIMVTTYPSQGEPNEKQITSWIENQHIGGVLFLKSSPYELASRANQYQAVAKVPLFIALDAENGLSFRMDSVVRYPHLMGLGALSSDSMIYQMGREVGQQCRALGINLNFAPVVDVNSNPGNPIINYRSFGENPRKVAQKGWALASGMQDERVLVTAKHFPGHGDTRFDSHLTLPQIDRDYSLMDSIDFLPFKIGIDSGINGIMSAHINLSKIDASRLPATLSAKVMTQILKDSLGFEGLLFSDGMNMKGITMHFNEGKAAVKALQAGVDVIEFVLNPEVVIQSVLKAVKKGDLTESSIDQKCRKVLLSKKWLGLDSYQPTDLLPLHEKINSAQYRLTARKLYEQSLTVLKNEHALMPLQRLDTLKVASFSIGKQTESTFHQTLSKYMNIDRYNIDLNASDDELKKILDQLKNYNLVIAGVYGTRLSASNNFNVKPLHVKAVKELVQQGNTILVFFSNPYAISKFDAVDSANGVVVTCGENALSETYAAQLIFGAIGTNATLPVSVKPYWGEGWGIVLKKNGRLKYTIPEEVGFDSRLLQSKIDSFANYGIRDSIFPGCQVLVAKQGKLIFHQSYGYYTYDSIRPVTNENIYDWASLTKITGPLPLIMKLTENSILKLDEPFSTYWPDFNGTDKANITLREVLAHQAGLKPWIPFYTDTFKKNNKIRKSILRDRPSTNFPVRVSSDLYIRKNYKQKIFEEIDKSELLKKKKYVYSGLAFYLFPDIISKITGGDYELCLKNSFLRPLGANSVTYNPYRYDLLSEIIPTENDLYFRKELLQGFVHDEGAAMLGGVSGNAGLFGTANDLAKIMQFYMDKGHYGDFNYLRPSTVDEFTKVQYPENENRRGLGFDKPYIDNAKKELKDAYPAPDVSPQSFGHSGYTGTFAWADPQNQLLFIFMSNRVYPTRENTKLFMLNFRPELQHAIYQCQDSFHYLLY